MKKTTTYLASLLVLLGSWALGPAAQAQGTAVVYQPLAVTGYNADVIAESDRSATANGAMAATNNTIDRGITNVKFCFADSSFLNSQGLAPKRALPSSGLVRSITTNGLTYQISRNGGTNGDNNDLRIDLRSGVNSGTLTLVRPVACSNIKILATQGNGNNVADNFFTLTFTDGTTQTNPGVIVPDWFGGNITPALYVGSRINRDTDGIDDNSVTNPTNPDPTIYEVDIPILAANAGKRVLSLSVTKIQQPGESTTAFTDPVLNIMGLSAVLTCIAPTGTVTAMPTEVCPGNPSTLTAILVGGTPGVTAQWQQSTNNGTTWTNITGATATTYIARPTVNTQYRYRTICTAAAFNILGPVTVSVGAPGATLAYSAASYCQAGNTGAPTVDPAGGTFTAPAGVSINPTNGTINLETSTAGTYSISYTGLAPCLSRATATVTIDPSAPPFTYTCPPFYKDGPNASPGTVTAAAGGVFSAPTGLVVNPSTGVADLTASAVGSYTVTYTTPKGCTSTASIEVVDKLIFPNVITPNDGDNLNDALRPHLVNVTNYRMEIFSRWGRRVWESTNPNEGWTAESKSGGTYYYRVDYTDCAGHAQTYKGLVEVIK